MVPHLIIGVLSGLLWKGFFGVRGSQGFIQASSDCIKSLCGLGLYAIPSLR